MKISKRGLLPWLQNRAAMHNILQMSSAGQAVMRTNLLSFGGDQVAIGSLFFIRFPGKLNPQQEEGEAVEGPRNKSEMKIQTFRFQCGLSPSQLQGQGRQHSSNSILEQTLRASRGKVLPTMFFEDMG